MNGGRFDFDDGGTYCGGWEEGKAHGHGVCTGPSGQGEFAGAWHYGFEVSGIYIWPSGSTYIGQWQNGKRHGLGVEQRGRWIYKGEWTQGLKGRYGRREIRDSDAHYAGTWSNGLMDGYGTEKYSDGGTYEGQWLRGMRHGYGIRTSAAYGQAAKHRSRSSNATHASLTSLRSNFGTSVSIDEGEELQLQPNHASGGGGVDSSRSKREKSKERKKAENLEPRSGFVLRVYKFQHKRKRSLSERSLAMKRTILSGLRIRKQYSTDDIHQRMTTGGAMSFRSSDSTLSYASDEDALDRVNQHKGHGDSQPKIDPVEPTAIEIYRGEWKNDTRTGFGICERSDGLRYIGEWLENKRHGYGITFFKDGTKEEGRYKNNELASSARRKGFLFIRSTRFRERIDSNIDQARRGADLAKQRVEIAQSRMMTAQEKADLSIEAANRAKDDADTARICATQFDPTFKQPGIEHLRQYKQRNTTPTSILLQNHIIAAANHIGYESTSGNSPHYSHPIDLQQDSMTSSLHQQYQTHSAPDRYGQYTQHNLPMLEAHYPRRPSQELRQFPLPNVSSRSDQDREFKHDLDLLKQNNKFPPLPSFAMNPVDVAEISANSSTVGHLLQTRQKQAKNPIKGVMANTVAGDGSPSTVSLADDHFDQYAIRRSITLTGTGTQTKTADNRNNTGAGIRRNRPSLMRQSEVGGSGTPSPDIGGITSKELTNDHTALIRRSTLATSRERRFNAIQGTTTEATTLSVYGPDLLLNSKGYERGSLPNLEDLAANEILLKREEAAQLASQRRLATQRRLQEEELLRGNPLRYLFHDALKNWLFRWRVPILMVVGNLLLFYYFMHLLTTKSVGNQPPREDD